jgi:hypothetical protein
MVVIFLAELGALGTMLFQIKKAIVKGNKIAS